MILEKKLNQYEQIESNYLNNSLSFSAKESIQIIDQLDLLKKEIVVEFYNETKQYNSLENCLSLLNNLNCINFIKKYVNQNNP